MPMKIPTGEAIAKMKMHHLTVEKSFGKVLTRAIPSELPAILLWTPIAITILRHWLRFIWSPQASPSKKLWTERASMRRKGLILHPLFFFLCESETSLGPTEWFTAIDNDVSSLKFTYLSFWPWPRHLLWTSAPNLQHHLYLLFLHYPSIAWAFQQISH